MGWDECVFECGHNATFRMPAHREKGICACCLLKLKELLKVDEKIIRERGDWGSPNCSKTLKEWGTH